MNVPQPEARTASPTPAPWWRWVLLPFATLLGSMSGTFAIGVVMWFSNGFSEAGVFYLYILPLVSSALFGFLYAHIAYEMAPRGKLIAGTIMVTILGICALSGLFFTWASGRHMLEESIRITVSTVVTIIVAIVTLVEKGKS